MQSLVSALTAGQPRDAVIAALHALRAFAETSDTDTGSAERESAGAIGACEALAAVILDATGTPSGAPPPLHDTVDSTETACTSMPQSSADATQLVALLDAACGAALAVLASSHTNQDRFCAARGCVALVAAMRALPSEVDVQTSTCRALLLLTQSRDAACVNPNRQLAVAAGAFDALAAAMHAHASSALVHEIALDVIRNLVEDSDEFRTAAGAAGVCEALILSMRAHRAHPGVQERACRAIRFFVRGHNANQARFAAASGCDDVYAAHRYHPSAAGVQEWMCLAIFSLVWFPANKLLIAASGGAECIVEAMRLHADSPSVQGAGCNALANMASAGTADIHSAIVRAGGLTALVAAIQGHVSTIGPACWALKELASHSDDLRLQIALHPGVVATILARMLENASGQAAQEGCMILQRLVDVAESRRVIAACGGKRIIASIMSAHSANAQVQESGRQILDGLPAVTGTDAFHVWMPHFPITPQC